MNKTQQAELNADKDAIEVAAEFARFNEDLADGYDKFQAEAKESNHNVKVSLNKNIDGITKRAEKLKVKLDKLSETGKHKLKQCLTD